MSQRLADAVVWAVTGVLTAEQPLAWLAERLDEAARTRRDLDAGEQIVLLRVAETLRRTLARLELRP
jgi:hypothetical protein